MASAEDFLEDLKKLPFSVIEKAEFENMIVTITFKSGNKLQAKAPNDNVYSILKEEFIKNLNTEKVVIK